MKLRSATKKNFFDLTMEDAINLGTINAVGTGSIEQKLPRPQMWVRPLKYSAAGRQFVDKGTVE